MTIAELKHLEGVRGNFAVSDTEYVAITVTGIGAHSITTPHVIYSNVNGDINNGIMYLRSYGIKQSQLNVE